MTGSQDHSYLKVTGIAATNTTGATFNDTLYIEKNE